MSVDSPRETDVNQVLLPRLEVHAHAVVSPPAPQAKTRIVRPLGYQLSRIAEFLFPKRTNTRVLQPIIADLQAEYIEALDQGRPWKAKWVRLHGHFAVADAAARIISRSMLLRGVWRLLGLGSAEGTDREQPD